MESCESALVLVGELKLCAPVCDASRTSSRPWLNRPPEHLSNRFEWAAPLDWVEQSKDALHQSLHGYWVDPMSGQGYDSNAIKRLSKQEFSVGNFWLK